jgi:hypothetical protein
VRTPLTSASGRRVPVVLIFACAFGTRYTIPNEGKMVVGRIAISIQGVPGSIAGELCLRVRRPEPDRDGGHKGVLCLSG